MREYRLVLDEYGIDEWRYRELKAFCRQYPTYKAKAAALLGVAGGSKVQTFTNSHGQQEGVVMPSGKGTTSDPVSKAAEERERYLGYVDMIDRCAKAVYDGKFADALIRNICYGMAYRSLDKTKMPTSDRNVYFDARRKFFGLLDMEKKGEKSA